ncbi:MAG: hypothetical protein ABIT09_06390 [Croceibacterium sp.]
MAWIALATVVALLLFGLFVPVYTDEIGWRFQERAGIDGIDMMINDVCGHNTLATPPWFMLPVRWFSAAANTALPSPLYVRIEGTGCALLWLTLLLQIIRLGTARHGERSYLTMLAAGLIGMGLLPLLMVMSRPEQPLIICTTAMVIIALAQGRDDRASNFVLPLKVAGVVALAAIALSYHLKGVLYSPVAAACIVTCRPGRHAVVSKVAGLACLIALTALAAAYWTSRFSCPGDPVLAAKLAHQNVLVMLGRPSEYLRHLPGLFLNALPQRYVALTVPAEMQMSGWIPAHTFPAWVAFVFGPLQILVWTTAIGMAALSLMLFAARHGVRAVLEVRFAAPLAILACVLVWGFSQNIKNDYEAAHVLPLLALAIVLSATLAEPAGAIPRLLHGLAPVAVALTMISTLVVVIYCVGPLTRAAGSPGFPPNQLYSVANFHFGQIRRDAYNAMQRAHFPKRRLRRVLVDDTTYFILQGSYLPLHRLGVIETWVGRNTDPVVYLVSRRSDGIVMGCKLLPQALQDVAVRSGAVCAVNASTLRAMVSAASSRDAEREL